jgi:hypothetical protein
MHREIKIFTDAFLGFFQPLIAAAATPSNAKALMLNLGYVPPEQFGVFDNLSARANSIRDVIESMVELSEEDIEADPQLLMDSIKNGLESISGLLNDIQNLSTIVQSELNGTDLLAQTDIVERLPLKLYDYLTIRYLKEHHNTIYSALKLFGIIEIKEIREASNPFEFPRLERTFHWDKLSELLTSPMRLLKASLKDNSGYFYEKTMLVIQEAGQSFGLMPHYKFPDPDVLKFINNDFLIDTWPGFDTLEILRFPLVPNRGDGLGLDIYPLINTTDSMIKGLVLVLRVDPGETVFVINDNLKLVIELSGIANGLGIVLDENDEFRFVADLFASPQNLPDNVQFDFRAMLTRNDEADGDNAEKLFQLGTADGNRFEVGSYNLTFGIEKQQNARLYLETELLNCFIRMKFDGADGFISNTLGDGIESDFSFGIGFANDQGFYFAGSSGLEIELPAHITLGPLQIRSLSVGITSTEEKIVVTFASSVQVNMGPVTLLVRDIGVSFPGKSDTAVFVPNVTFKPPTGVGLVIDGSGFTGGGFLRYIEADQRYEGMLELEYEDRISLKAIGLLTTRLPGGRSGFSLLIIITAEFNPIQLGLGFTLKGVGGLLGLNRTADAERLRSGLRGNTLSSVLFPQNVIENASRILSDVNQLFPAQSERLIFGPMARLGWGSPTLITIDLGVLVEIPDPVRVLILGVIRALLPDEKAKLLQLQVNFLGVIDFQAQRLSIDASLYDSKLLSFTLSGDMAVRLSWGAEPNFLLTVGGFHPAYQPPPLNLPTLRRLSLQLTAGDNPRLTLEAYFAVTANTRQFGARAELLAKAGSFSVYGFLSFDVLFQFSPFYFIASISAKLALRAGGSEIASISLDFTLEGPTPWHVKGTARLKICWFLTIKVSFDKTFGERLTILLPDILVLPLLRAALADPGNWEAQPARGRPLLVTFKEIAASGGQVVAAPFGVLTIQQRVAPLGIDIQRFGSQRPADGNRFAIEKVIVGEDAQAEELSTSAVSEQFAPADFFELTDAKKLSSKSFERYDSGVKLADSEASDGEYAVRRNVAYELFYVDAQRDLVSQGKPLRPDFLTFHSWAVRGAVAASPLSQARNGTSALAPGAVQVSQEGFAVVRASDLQPVAAEARAASEAGAQRLMDRLLRDNPALDSEILVVPAFEVNHS